MTRIKICGITNVEDLAAVLDAGADYVGIVRVPSSPRYVENPTELAALAAGRAAVIGVYAEYNEDRFVEVFDSIQTFSQTSRPNVLRVYRLGETPVENIVGSANGPLLLDAFSPAGYGGTGTLADWDQAAEVVARAPFPVFLAGGLTPDNVAEAIRKVQPFAVDVSSGVEASPGRKDRAKVRAFVEATRNV